MSAALWSAPLRALAEPTFIEAWPARGWPLTPDEAAALDEGAPLYRDRLGADDPPGLHALAARLTPLLAAHPAGAFVRLGSGSPKDSPLFAINQGRCAEPITAIKLLQTSRRLRSHLRHGLAAGHVPHLHVRPWIRIEPWQELRCFVRRRHCVGLCQLDVTNHRRHPELALRSEAVDRVARALVDRLIAASHLDSAVFDIVLRIAPAAPDGLTALLLEINPWGRWTDAVLFDWRRPEDFDGSFRCLG